MNIWINNLEEQIDCINLYQLLVKKNIHQKNGMAVAINNQVIGREQWNTAILKEGDKITLIQASAGG
jgi:sulfur carrier protein